MRNLLIISTTALALVSGPVMAHHTDIHVRASANQEITKRKPELKGQKGDRGPQGPRGMPGATFLYAHVFANGTVDASRSFGISQSNVAVNHQGSPAGSYCFTGIGASGAQVTVDWRQAPSNETAQVDFGPTDGCEFYVSILKVNGNWTPGGFYIIVY